MIELLFQDSGNHSTKRCVPSVFAEPIKTRRTSECFGGERNVATNELFPALSIPKTATIGQTGDSIIVRAWEIPWAIDVASEFSGETPVTSSRWSKRDLKLDPSIMAWTRKSDSILASWSRRLWDTVVICKVDLAVCRA